MSDRALADGEGQLRSAWIVGAFGFFALMFEGYDLIVYGSAVPTLLSYSAWHLTPAEVGAIGGVALFGMFFGAPIAGWLADRFGRRTVYMGILSFFSAMMIGVALAPSPALFGMFRFLAGLGFGGLPPTVVALVVEFAPVRRRLLFTTGMSVGFGVGGISAGLVAIALLAEIGFRGLFAVGALPLVTLVPLAAWLLPESPSFRSQPSAPLVQHKRPTAWASVLRGRAGLATALFAAANFSGLMMSFGLNIWLPQLMRNAGYDLGPALQFLVTLNIGALVGAIAGGLLADRFGGRIVATSFYLIGALSLVLLIVPLSPVMRTLLVFIAGATALSNQSVLFGYIATHYASEFRATALGVTSGIGRLGAAAGPFIGGLLVGAGVGLGGNVGVFAAAAVIAAAATFMVPRAAAPSNPRIAPLASAAGTAPRL
jgi:MFS transporter, AAHS family, benzoate transport protein